MSASSAGRVQPSETRLGLRLFLVHAGCLGAWYAVGVPSNAVITGFALDYLGMSAENAGLIGACLYAAAIFQFLSFALTNRITNRKRFVLLVGAGEMVFLSGAMLVPFVFGPGDGRTMVLFFATLFLSGMCLHLSQPLLMGWLSELIPARIRGRYLGSRQLLTTGVHTVVSWLCLRVIDQWTTWGGFALVTGLCCLCGLLGIVALTRAPMPRLSQDSRFAFGDVLHIGRHQPFRRYLAFIVVAHAAFALACSYYMPFFREEVGLSFRQISWYIIGHNVFMVAVLRPVGKLVDRYGARPVIIGMCLLYALFFFSFPLFTASTIWLVLVMWSLVGIADGAYCVGVTSTLYHCLPKGPERTGYLASAQSVVLLSMAIGPFLVRGYLDLASSWRFQIAGVTFERFRIMFWFCGVLMIGASYMATKLVNTREVHFGQLVAALFRTRPFKLVPRFWSRDGRVFARQLPSREAAGAAGGSRGEFPSTAQGRGRGVRG